MSCSKDRTLFGWKKQFRIYSIHEQLAKSAYHCFCDMMIGK